MAVIVIPERWQRQPAGPVEIDWNHGMAGDLIGAFVGGRDVDLCQPNTPPVYTNAAAAQQEHVATEYGIAREIGGLSGHMYWPTQRRIQTTGTRGMTTWGRLAPWSAAPSNYVFATGRDEFSQRFGWGYEVTTRRFRAYVRDWSSGNQFSAVSTTPIDQWQWHDAGAVYAPGTLYAWLNGHEVASLSCTATYPHLRFALANTTGPSFVVPVCYLWDGVHPEFMPELSRNPWQLLRKRLYKFVSLGGPAADLDGDATGTGTATGDLTTAIPLVGAAVATGAAAGDLATAVQLAGAAAASAGATGALSTGIPLAGAAASVTLAGGALTTQIRLDGAALAAALASGALDSGSAALAGDAQAAGAAAGSLTTIIVLQGAAVGGALAAADLTAPGAGLAGAATAGALASASLTTQIPLAGGAQATVIASGEASTSISLAGAAVGVVSATGDLVIALGLSADAVAAALAGASLTTSVTLRADAVAGAQAGGSLAGVIYIASARRTARVAARVRVAAVARRVRTHRVAPRVRTQRVGVPA